MKQREHGCFVTILGCGLSVLLACWTPSLVVRAVDNAAAVDSLAGATAAAVFDFIETLYDQQDRALNDYLAEQLAAFIRTFPVSEHVATARFLQGRVALEAGDDHRAFACFMKTLFLHPGTMAHAKAAEGARMVITTNKSYQEHRNELLGMIGKEETTEKPADRFYSYISFLHGLDQSKLLERSRNEYQEFLSFYPTDPRNETVLHWIAESHLKQRQYREAVASYLKFEYMFPTSNLLAAVRIRRAELLSEKLKEPEQAMAALTAIIVDAPRTDVAGTALFLRASIKAEKRKDHLGAVADYRQLASSLPQHGRAVDAMLAMAEIYAKKLKDYGEAVTVYDQVAENYPRDPKSITALKESSKIYEDRLKQPATAAARYARIADLFPENEQAAEALLEAAKISRNQAKDYQQAAEYYQRIVDDYPRTDQARKAREELAKLQGASEG